MAQVHCHGDSRNCAASTTVVGQSTVYIGGKLASVKGDTCSHGAGALLADTGPGTVFINNLPVVTLGSAASIDKLLHINPSASSASATVFVGN
jgi:uncharacterized Zn-binding protein involved in type VI secretion